MVYHWSPTLRHELLHDVQGCRLADVPGLPDWCGPVYDLSIGTSWQVHQVEVCHISNGAWDSWQPVGYRQALWGGQWLGQHGQLVKCPAEKCRSSTIPEDHSTQPSYMI
jgi:hypothetical protein